MSDVSSHFFLRRDHLQWFAGLAGAFHPIFL